MALKFLSFLFLSFICSNAFAMECSDDEKFMPISENQIGYSMYKESIYAEPIQGLKGGKWALKNTETKYSGVCNSAKERLYPKAIIFCIALASSGIAFLIFIPICLPFS